MVKKYCQQSDQKVRRVLLLSWLLISIEAISRPIRGINFSVITCFDSIILGRQERPDFGSF